MRKLCFTYEKTETQIGYICQDHSLSDNKETSSQISQKNMGGTLWPLKYKLNRKIKLKCVTILEHVKKNKINSIN